MDRKNNLPVLVIVLLLVVLALGGPLVTFQSLSKSVIQYNGSISMFHIIEQNKDSFCIEKIAVPDTAVFRVDTAPDTTGISQPQTASSFSKNMLTFPKTPSLLTWMIFFSVTVGVGLVLLVLYLQEFLLLIKNFAFPRALILSMIVIVIATFSYVFYSSTNGLVVNSGEVTYISAYSLIDNLQILFSSTTMIRRITAIVTGIGFLGIVGMITIPICITLLRRMNASALSKFNLLTSLNASMMFFFSSVSILIGFSITNTAILRQALMTAINMKGIDIFPAEYVYGYGFLFTIILAAIYLPIDLFLRKAIKNISVNNWPEAKKKIYEKVTEQSGGLQNIQALLSVLAPLAGSLLPDLISKLPVL